MINKEYCVYVHKNLINGNLYFGITNNTDRRWRNDGIEYKPKSYENPNRPFWNAIKKYGWDNFDHIVIESDLSYEEACVREKEYIKTYRECGYNLYNIAEGGNGGKFYIEHPKGMLGKHHTEENKERHREWASNKDNNCMTNGKVVWGVTHEHPKGMKGKTHSDEYKKRLSIELRENPTFSKKCGVVYPNGTIEEYVSMTKVAENLGISTSTVRRLMRSGNTYKLAKNVSHNRENLEKLIGIRIILIEENTEITNSLKAS